MSAQPASTITVHLTPGQCAAYLTDWEHRSETDDTDQAALYDQIASAKLSTLTDAEGKRRRRHVLTLTRAQACDLLTNIAYAMELKTSDADDGDTDATNRIKHHGAAHTVVRAAGAETITELNARTGETRGQAPAGQELPARAAGDREDSGMRDVIRQSEARVVADQEEADAKRHDVRLAEITAGVRPHADTAARRVRAWTDTMRHRIAYGLGVYRGEPASVAVADARALAEHTATAAQREQLRTAVTTFLTHADGEPRTLASSHGTRPPLLTYDVLVLLDRSEDSADEGDGEGDGLTCPNGNRPPECIEIDPCEACAQDADAEAEEIEASMGLRNQTDDGDRPDPRDVYEVTVFRTEMITFTLSAASAQDAEERYLMDGEEIGSETVKMRVDSTNRQEDPEPLRPT
ncbi:hypothetical protein OG883_45545 [Streptomyces sp. NBC_01142]|uniref:hypothetical protein n=1 Tax=Streptomyces sp. NBC_01142 TaxID=2975865 RepID=UPI0022596D1A|nr:hypothetical protein [Streptomyces sp. NBC_01142]MCX4826905.1 hypothetical protein [Streptomyces sp. NBC_01142]